jgi:hypothetical protein
MTADLDNPGPRIDVRQAREAQPRVARGSGPWNVAFELTSRESEPVELVDAWLPHARFHAEARDLDGARLAPGASVVVEFTAAFDEPPGTEAENAFVILRVRWRGELWRVLTRMTVATGADGAPAARVEAVSTHRVGFSN